MGTWLCGGIHGSKIFLVGVSGISALAALSDSEAVLVTVENGSAIKLIVVSPSGQVKRSVVIAASSVEDLERARPQVLVNRSRITVVWRDLQREPFFDLFAAKKSPLVVQSFSSALIPLGGPEELSEDPFVVPFSVEQTSAGAIISWDQGVRGPWNVASFVRFSPPLARGHSSRLRFPSGRLPLSVVETDAGVLALVWRGEPGDTYRTILFEPPPSFAR
jgi:hypothetical protein